MNAFLTNIKQFLSRLTRGQQLALGLVVAGGLGLLIGIAYWAGRPDFAILFGNLDPTDANKIVESLKSEAIAYDLRENGTAIFVPREDVYELRLRFAGEGLVSDGTVGYELFDKGTLGMTDFMQKLNLKRALEGELARTISSIKQVELCRVHLVLPERSPFRESQTQPSASVVLQLGNSGKLSAEQVSGITELVAGAVEGLSASAVTILDTRGNLLSNPEANNPDAVLNNTQLKMQHAIESHLAESGQSMLDRVVGPGNAIVRVSASLDFTRAVAEKEIIDPESATVISEEKLEEQDGGGTGSANSSVKNYVISKTNERSEKGGGDIRYLTVSVILNQKPQPLPEDAAEDATPQVVQYSPAELTEIENLVKNAVGFSPDRGDRFAIHQTRFDTSVDDQIAGEMRQERRNEQLQMFLRYGLMAVAIGLALWLMRSATRTLKQPAPAEDATDRMLPGGNSTVAALEGSQGDGAAGRSLDGSSNRQIQEGSEEELVLVEDVYTSKLSPEAKKRLKAKHLMYEEVKAAVLAKPAETAELLRSWIASENKS